MFYAGRGPKRHLTHLVALLAVMATQVRFQAQSKELELSCDNFVDNKTAHCSCSIDKTAADKKCRYTFEGELSQVQISLRPQKYKASPGKDVTLCNFDNFFSPPVVSRSAEAAANCAMKEPDQGNIYVMETSFVAKRERHEGMYVTCWPGCKFGEIQADKKFSNDSAVLIKFDKPTTKSKPLDILFISAVTGVAVVASLIVGGVCIYFGIKRHNRNAWTPMPPTKRVCYDGPLPVQLPRTPSPKSSKSADACNQSGSHRPIAPPVNIALPEEKGRKNSKSPKTSKGSNEDRNSLMSSEVDDSEAAGDTNAGGVPDTEGEGNRWVLPL